MKIFITIMLVCILALGVVGAVGFFSHGFSSFDKSTIKQQISTLKESVDDLTNKVKDAFQKKEESEKTECTHGNVDDKGVCVDCGICTHKIVFNDICEGCGKSIEEIRANCEHEMEGCICKKCGYTDHDVDPETYECRKCGMLVINVNSECLNGHKDDNGDGYCDFCNTEMPTPTHDCSEGHIDEDDNGYCDYCSAEMPKEPAVIDRIHQLNQPTYYVGDEVDPNAVTVTVIYSDDSYDFAVPDELVVDTSTVGQFTGIAYYQGFSCDFIYDVIEHESEGPTGSGEQMTEEEGEW